MKPSPVAKKTRVTRGHWQWCVLTSVAIALLSIMPQIHLSIIRGRDWNGAFVSSQGDEFYYSAYINALIDGRPRKNDPFDSGQNKSRRGVGESTFSIQFIPPYVISFWARTFRSSASTAMIVLIAAAGFFASLSVIWLIDAVTNNYRLAAAGTFFVLCLGGLAAGSPLYPTLPFLRRYQPAATFPLFFLFNFLLWYSLTGPLKRARICVALACVTLVVRDYDEAIAYFTKTLGFRLVEDSPQPGGQRWVLVAPEGSPGLRILLARAATAAQERSIGNQTGGRVGFFLQTSDFPGTYARLRERGVRFLEEPRSEPYGTVVVFEDLYGNRWDLIAPRGSEGPWIDRPQ